jgi:hypothetical protein
MRRAAFVLAAIAIVPVLAGCGFSKKKQAAEQVAATYFEAMKKPDFDAAIANFSPTFFEKTPKEKWLGTLEAIHARFGCLQSYEQTGFKVNKGKSELGEGYFVELTFRTNYEKGSASEIIRCFESSSGGPMQIVGQNFSPDKADTPKK